MAEADSSLARVSLENELVWMDMIFFFVINEVSLCRVLVGSVLASRSFRVYQAGYPEHGMQPLYFRVRQRGILVEFDKRGRSLSCFTG